MKRTIPLIASFIIGLVMVGEFFIPHHQYRAMTNEFLEWGLVLSAGAFLLGLVNLEDCEVCTLLVCERGQH